MQTRLQGASVKLYNTQMKILTAKVEKLLITQPFDALPVSVKKVEVMLAGIKYDRHFGKTRNADVRTAKLLPKGIEVTNLRSVTIVSSEELKEISDATGVDVTAEDMEANITLSGVEKLTKLAPGTFIKFPRNTILYVTAENLPCVIPAQHMMQRGVGKSDAIKFTKAAFGRRGLTALVFASGAIKVGDDVEIYPPQSFE